MVIQSFPHILVIPMCIVSEMLNFIFSTSKILPPQKDGRIKCEKSKNYSGVISCIQRTVSNKFKNHRYSETHQET